MLLTNQINPKESARTFFIRKSSQLIAGWPERRNTNSIGNNNTIFLIKTLLLWWWLLLIYPSTLCTPHCADSDLTLYANTHTLSFIHINKKKIRWWIRNYVLCHYVMCSLLAIALQVIVTWWWHNCECLRVIFLFDCTSVCATLIWR